jgi:hypothetical protein
MFLCAGVGVTRASKPLGQRERRSTVAAAARRQMGCAHSLHALSHVVISDHASWPRLSSDNEGGDVPLDSAEVEALPRHLDAVTRRIA